MNPRGPVQEFMDPPSSFLPIGILLDQKPFFITQQLSEGRVPSL
jgi:hypothetical protein